MLCNIMTADRKKRRTGAVPVYLNVYDLTPINGYAYWLGLGIYHSGVQVHGVEYGFGAHDHATSGIFEVEPNRCPGFTFRKSILIGRTDLGPKEVRALMQRLASEYSGNSYHLISKNCNHFCSDVCIRLTGKPIPRWVNRLARLGLLCKCVLPAELAETRIRPVRSEVRVGEGETKKKKLRSRPSSFPLPSNHITPTSRCCPSSSGGGRSRQRRCLPLSSLLAHDDVVTGGLKI